MSRGDRRRPEGVLLGHKQQLAVPALRGVLCWALCWALCSGLGCDSMEGKSHKGSSEPVASDVAPGSVGGARARSDRPETGPRLAPSGDLCEDLCSLRGGCFETYSKIGLDPLRHPLPPGAPEPCLASCRRVESDLLLGVLLARQHARCVLPSLSGAQVADRDACDAFLGCSLRHRLTLLAEVPWLEPALWAALQLARVREHSRKDDPTSALKVCVESQSPRKRLRELLDGGERGEKGPLAPPGLADAAAASRRLEGELARQCQAAQQTVVQALVGSIQAALRDLRLEEAGASCRRMQDLLVLPDAGEVLGARVAEASRACESIPPLRAVATAVADAEADSALVNQELDRGGGGTAAYHKCVHKASTLGTLEASDHPKARAAQRVLRAACFQRFPVEWLREVQRRREPPDRAQCFRIRLVSQLLQHPGSPAAERVRHQPLLKWAKDACP